MIDHLFGEVRAAFAVKPLRWGRVVESLEGYDEEAHREAFLTRLWPYMEEGLEALESEERRLPSVWFDALRAHGAWAPARLVRVMCPGQEFTWEQRRSLGRVMRSPDLGSLLSLQLNDFSREEDARFLADMRLPRLRELLLHRASLTNAALRGLLANPSLGAVRRLDLGWSVHLEDVRSFCEASVVQGLVELGLEGVGLESREGARLLGSEGLGRLRRLHLGWNDIGRDGAQVLTRAPYLAQLTHLGLENNSLETRSVANLLRAFPPESELRGLALYSNRLGPEVAHVLAESPAFASLESLDLDATAIGDSGRKALLGSEHLSELIKESVSTWRAYDS